MLQTKGIVTYLPTYLHTDPMELISDTAFNVGAKEGWSRSDHLHHITIGKKASKSSVAKDGGNLWVSRQPGIEMMTHYSHCNFYLRDLTVDRFMVEECWSIVDELL